MKIIYYTAEWCMPCQTFKPLVQRVADELGITVEYMDIEKNEVKHERIMSIPTLAIYNKKGERVETLVGAYPEAKFREVLSRVR